MDRMSGTLKLRWAAKLAGEPFELGMQADSVRRERYRLIT